MMYYFIPKQANRPVYSYRLSIIHFWALIFMYIWAGPHHLHYTALPDWAQTLGMVFSIMLWMPSWGGMINGLMTLSGAWDKLRTGPDLVRVGGRYSNDWHIQHLRNPRDVVSESIMPPYAFLADNDLDTKTISAHLVANRRVGVPYTDDMIAAASQDMQAQANPDLDGAGVIARYPKAVIANYDGDAARFTEMDHHGGDPWHLLHHAMDAVGPWHLRA
jgi:Cytochrome C oxidase, mono-heme subunit/FixO/Cytochrome C and Quinol oxidase polypeptide I